MGILSPIDKRKVIEFYNDDSFQVVDMPTYDGSVVRKNENNLLLEGWPLIKKMMMPFNGKGLGFKKNQRIMLISENDIIEDPFNILLPTEKPEEGPELVKSYVQSKAASVVYRHQSKPKSVTALNRVVMFLGIAVVMLGIVTLIRALKG